MASQLLIYNEALEHLGERPLASISEEREPRRALDGAWDTTVKFCIEQGFWNWALRSVTLDPEPGIETSFGFSSAFLKPDDWARTLVISENETFDPPIYSYLDESGYWFADTDALYARYVSNHSGFGANLSVWPESFSAYVACRLARRVCRRLTNSQELFETLYKLETRAKNDAQSKDAMNQGPERLPLGSWATSRGDNVNRSRWNGRFS